MPYIGTSPSNGVRRVHTYTATASQTTFTGASSEGVTLSYVDTNYIDVFQNGVLLGSADYTSTSGTSVVLAQGASADDLVVIVVYDVFSVADTVSKSSGGAFDGNITMAGTLDVTGLVGIGNSVPSSFNGGANNLVVGTGSGSEGMSIYADSSSNSAIFFADGTSGAATYTGQINYQHASDAMTFHTNGGTENMRIDSIGAVTKPNQPACLVFVTSIIYNLPVANTTIQFDNEIYDQNSDFDTSNYTFTAPITGKYLINFSLYGLNLDAGANYIEPYINTSNRSYYTGTFDPDNGDGYDLNYFNFQGSVVADMDANDIAKIIVTQGGGNAQMDVATNSFLSVTLVC